MKMDFYICMICGGHCKQSRLEKFKNVCRDCNNVFELEDVLVEGEKPLLMNVSESKIQEYRSAFKNLGLERGQVLQLLHLESLPEKSVISRMCSERIGFLKAFRLEAWDKIDRLLSTEP